VSIESTGRSAKPNDWQIVGRSAGDLSSQEKKSSATIAAAKSSGA